MNTLKKVSALVIALMLIFSMCMVSVSAAETEASTATVLYMKPGSNWVQASPRYAMYLFNSKENTWVDMTDADEDGYYEAEIPEGDWTSVIFCRMNPNKKDNNWNNKWNQTSDLAIPDDGTNCYLVKDGTWDKGGGEWTTYTPGEEPSTAETEPTTAPSYKYTVAGDAGLCGVAWTPASAENALTDEDGDGVYEITYKDVPAGSYSFKVTDGTWNNSWGKGSGNYSINLNDTADVTIKFTESTKAIEVVSDGLGDFVLKHMTVVGDEGLVGAKWDPKAEEGVMTQDADGIWNITFENVAAGEYEYKFIANDSYTYNWTVEGYFDSSANSIVKVDSDGADVTLTIDVSGFDFATKKGSVKATAAVTGGTPTEPSEATDPTESTAAPSQNDYYLFGTINGANYGCEDDWETIGDYKFVDGKLSTTFDTVSYVAVKTGDNKGWYMTDGWAGIAKSVVLYSTSTLGETANKLIVPAGKVDFTLVENEDGSLTLSYESENEPEIPTEASTASTDPTESTAAPSTTDYYLFGSINGANYGCEDDWQTIGDYKFVDGKLSTTFDTVSYVAVKTGDNKSWYMTDGWAGITKSVTLYTTDKLGEDANKLIVPAGKVDFTLVENEDGTLTLSYESENEPEIPTEEPSTAEPTEEPTTAPVTEPTTEAPTTEPTQPVGETTLNFVVPKTVSSPKCWDDGIYLAYSNQYAINTFTKIQLTKTTDFLTPDLKTDRLTAGTYALYTVTLSKEQAEAVSKAIYVVLVNNSNTYKTYVSSKYNLLKAPTGTYSADYNTAKTSLADLNGYTFIMNGEVTTGTSIDGYGTYTGYWTKCTTVYAVTPASAKWKNCWNQGVYIGYSNDYKIGSFNKIKMTRTSTYVDVDSKTSQLVSGAYPVYTVTLTEDQVAAIDASTYVIFENASGTYRTYINGKYSVMKAPAGSEYSSEYTTTKAKLADRAKNTFVICDGLSTGSSIEGYGTFTGYWSTSEIEIVESTATLYCVFPTPAKGKTAMNNGVYLAYGSSNSASDLTKIAMEETDEKYTPSLKTNALVDGEYSVYSVTLNSDQIEALDGAKNVVFCSSNGNFRTILSPGYNVFNAKSGSYSATYNKGTFTTADHNGETFVVCDSKVTGSSTDGYGMFLGYWDLGEK